jgi:hypothetical protein
MDIGNFRKRILVGCVCDNKHCGHYCNMKWTTKNDIIECINKMVCDYNFNDLTIVTSSFFILNMMLNGTFFIFILIFVALYAYKKFKRNNYEEIKINDCTERFALDNASGDEICSTSILHYNSIDGIDNIETTKTNCESEKYSGNTISCYIFLVFIWISSFIIWIVCFIKLKEDVNNLNDDTLLCL